MKARIQAVLPGGADGPVMEPRYDASRVITLADYSATERGLLIWWHAGTGHATHRAARAVRKAKKRGGKKPPPFGDILGYHAEGLVPHAPVRDVRLSRSSINQIKLEARKWWEAEQRARERTAARPRRIAAKPAPRPVPVPVPVPVRPAVRVEPPKPAPTPKPTPKPTLPKPVRTRLPQPAAKPPTPVPERVRERAEYLIKAKIDPALAVTAARRKVVKERLATLPAEIDAAQAEAWAQGRALRTARTGADLKAAHAGLKVAQDRLRMLEDRKSRLEAWRVEAVKNPNLIPPWEIKDRLAEYTRGEGGVKLKAILGIGDELEALQREGHVLKGAAAARVQAILALSPRSPERAGLMAQYEQVKERVVDWVSRQAARADAVRERIIGIFRPAKPLPLTQGPTDPAKMGTVPLIEADRPAVDEAFAWIKRVVAEAGAGRQIVAVGTVKDAAIARSHAGVHGIALGPGRDAATVVHEFGHVLESRTGAGFTARDFLAHRVGNEPATLMNDVAPEGGYGPDERGRKDKFDEVFEGPRAYYVGKDYDGKATEITAMGLEQLYRDPITFAKKDPEFATLIIGILDGSLR